VIAGVKNEEEKFGSKNRQSNNGNDDDSGNGGRGTARVPNYYIVAADRLLFNLIEVNRVTAFLYLPVGGTKM
jgi:hypothetical protein